MRDEGKQAAVDEVGELWVRGGSVFSGYLGNPTATAEVLVDGWMEDRRFRAASPPMGTSRWSGGDRSW